MLTKSFKKEGNSLKLNIYKLVPNIEEKYINRILIESCPINILEKILFKEDTSRILKFAKAKLKINTKKYTKEQVKELAITYLEDDSKKSLYNMISNVNIKSVNRFFSMKSSEDNITLDIFNNEDEFIRNINILLQDINVFILVSYMRAKHENLFNIIPYILKEWESGNEYLTSGIKDEGYRIEFKEKFSQKYGFKLEFQGGSHENENNYEQVVPSNINESKISTNINNIVSELQNISKVFETLDSDKSKIKVLERDLKENKKLLKKAKDEIQYLKKELEISKCQLEDQNISIENLHSTIKTKTQKEDELKVKVDKLNSNIKGLETLNNNKLKNLQKDLNESLQNQSELSSICNNLKNISEQFEKKADELKEELVLTSDSLEYSLSINKNLENENKELRLKTKQLEEIVNSRSLSTNESNAIEQNLNSDDINSSDDSWINIDELLDTEPVW